MLLSISTIPLAVLSANANQTPINSPESNSKPNILIILADDMSYRDLSSYGQTRYYTPNIDSLLSQGVRFTNAYSAAPESAPSRCSFLTGLHTGHSSVRLNSSARGQDNLLDSDITFAEVLKERGYNTAFVGKWGVGLYGTEGVPYKQGFDYAFGFYDQTMAHTYIPDYLYENEKKVNYPQNSGFDMERRYDYSKAQNTYDKDGKLYISELDDPYDYAYSENEMQNSAMNFLSKHFSEQDKQAFRNSSTHQPFLLYYATQLPHGPVMVDDIGELSKGDEGTQVAREWGAMIVKLDKFVGDLVKRLKETGEYDNTIIIFASDNGYSMCGYTSRGNGPKWEDDPYLHNKGSFRGGKFTALEGGIRIPFFIHYPKMFKNNVISTPVCLIDVFPTLLDLTSTNCEKYNSSETAISSNSSTDEDSLTPQTDRNRLNLDGKSLKNLLVNGIDNSLEMRPLYFSRGAEQSLRMGPYSIYKQNKNKKSQLYLIEEDCYQERDLSNIYPEIIEQAEKIMQESVKPHPWYWTPLETREEYLIKVNKAKETGNILPINRPNGIKQFPWEKKR